MRRIHPRYKKKSSLSIQMIVVLFVLVQTLLVAINDTLTTVWAPTKKLLIRWQFSGPYGVTKYSSGWRKDVVNQCLEFGSDPVHTARSSWCQPKGTKMAEGCVVRVHAAGKVQRRPRQPDLGSADRWRNLDLSIRSGNRNAVSGLVVSGRFPTPRRRKKTNDDDNNNNDSTPPPPPPHTHIHRQTDR